MTMELLDEEELRRILDEGSATPTQGDELAMLRADLARQGESMTPSMGEAMPKGTKVVFAEETQAPVTPQSAAARMPIVPKVVDVSNQPTDDMEMTYARAQDRKAKSREAFERGTRELIAGLTRTQVAPTFRQDTDAVAKLLAKRKERDAATERTNAQRLQASRFDYERKTQAQKDAETKAKDERDFEYRQKHDAESIAAQRENAAANRGIAAAGLGIRQAQEKREAEKDARGRDLSATEIASLAELPVAEAQVDALAETFMRLDMGGIKGNVAQKAFDVTGQGFGTGVDEYDAASRLAEQAAGKIVEGGKLAAGDELKYRRMMPRPGDTPEVVKQKAQGMKQFLRDLATKRAKGFKAARFNVPDELMPGAEDGGGPVQSMTTPGGSGARPTITLADGSKAQLSADGKSWEPIK